MATLHEGKEVWLLVKTLTSEGWIKVCSTLDDAIEEFVVATKIRHDNYLRIIKVEPNASSDKIIDTIRVDKEMVWKRAFELHDPIKNRLVLEKANADRRE